MTTPMGTVPRFVPTLTEVVVVQAPQAVGHDMVPALMQELVLVLENRLREETARLHDRLQQELELRLREALAQAMTEREADKSGKK